MPSNTASTLVAPPTAVGKAIPKARTRQTKVRILLPTSSTQARLPLQPVKAQEVDLPKGEQKATTPSRIAAVVRLVRVEVEEHVEDRQTDLSQRFTNTMRLKKTIIMTR